jgi:segregation and condensation protein B
MRTPLEMVLEVLLFSSSDPLSIKEFQRVFRAWLEEQNAVEAPTGEEGEDVPGAAEILFAEVPSSGEIREALAAIQSRLEEDDAPFRLREGPSGYTLVNPAAYADWVRLLRDAPRPARLSVAALETLSIIAYRQPVTRSSMERIRGVSIDSALGKLMELELVQALGRADLPGRPVEYGTTDRFLEFCGIRSLEELPASDVLSAAQLDSFLESKDEHLVPGDAEMGLAVVDEETGEVSR